MTAEEYIKIINEKIGEGTAELAPEDSSHITLAIKPGQLLAVSTLLYEFESFYFDLLECITGIDNGPESNEIEVIYNLYSIPFNHGIALKVVLPRENPSIETLSGIWKTADWHEREAFDLLGIQFKNHPDLRRILMPNDWIGFPLRKDYSTDDTYHGIKIDY